MQSVHQISPSCAIHSQKQASVRNLSTKSTFHCNPSQKTIVRGRSMHQIRRPCAIRAKNQACVRNPCAKSAPLVQSVADFRRPCALPSQNQTFLRHPFTQSTFLLITDGCSESMKKAEKKGGPPMPPLKGKNISEAFCKPHVTRENSRCQYLARTRLRGQNPSRTFKHDGNPQAMAVGLHKNERLKNALKHTFIKNKS